MMELTVLWCIVGVKSNYELIGHAKGTSVQSLTELGPVSSCIPLSLQENFQLLQFGRRPPGQWLGLASNLVWIGGELSYRIMTLNMTNTIDPI